MMKQEDLFKKLGLILNELNEQYQFLAQNPQQLNELELELFHANANFLADHVQIIKKINLSQQAPLALAPADENQEHPENATVTDDIQDEQQMEEIAFSDQPEDFEPFVEEKPTPDLAEIEEEVFKLDNEPSKFEFILNDHSEHEKFDFEEKSVDEIFDRPLSEEEEHILAQKRKLREHPIEEIIETDEDEIGPEPFLVRKEDFPITSKDIELEEAPIPEVKVDNNELIEDPTYKPTLNDLLANRSATNLNATSTTGITDLKQAINLNDKLLYIKDLFNGYNLAYAEAIELANKLPNFEAADNFFKKNYAVKNNWAEKQTTVDKFYELLNQRFK